MSVGSLIPMSVGSLIPTLPRFYPPVCIYSNMGKWKGGEASLLLLSRIYNHTQSSTQGHHSSTCLGVKLVSSSIVILNILVSRIGYVYLARIFIEEYTLMC